MISKTKYLMASFLLLTISAYQNSPEKCTPVAFVIILLLGWTITRDICVDIQARCLNVMFVGFDTIVNMVCKNTKKLSMAQRNNP